MTMLFTQPDVVPKLYDFLFSMEHKRRYFEKCLTMEVSGQENYLVLQKKESRTVWNDTKENE